ncbi:MAG: hypothetical protein AB7V37_12105 [Eubacteriaceae bacterium]
MEIISVWGSPSSGKTTLSIEIGKMIADQAHNCLVIFTDDLVGPINYLFPSADEIGGSLGDVLMNSTTVQNDIFRSLLSFSDHKYLSFSGYRKNQSRHNFSEISDTQINDFFVSLSQNIEYVIVDCKSDFIDDPISKYALNEGTCIQVGGGDYKSISYFQNCQNHIHGYEGILNRNTIIVNNPWDFDCWMTIADQYGGDVKYCFPFCMEILENYLEEKSLSVLKENKKTKAYINELNLLVNALIGQDDMKVKKRTKKEKPKKEKKKSSIFKKKSKGDDEHE